MIELSYNVFDLSRYFCPKDHTTLLLEMCSLYITTVSNLVVIVIMVAHIQHLSCIHAGTGN